MNWNPTAGSLTHRSVTGELAASDLLFDHWRYRRRIMNKGCAVGVSDRVSELAVLVNRSGGLKRDMAGYAPRK